MKMGQNHQKKKGSSPFATNVFFGGEKCLFQGIFFDCQGCLFFGGGIMIIERLIIITLPETNIAPKNGWLEYYFPIGKAYFQGRTVSFREGTVGVFF